MPNPIPANATGLPSDPLETAMADGARRAFAKRATALRREAQELATTTTDREGRIIPIVPPEARVKASTADVLDECAEVVAPTSKGGIA